MSILKADLLQELFLAIDMEDLDLVKDLMAEGLDVDSQDEDGETILMKAINYGTEDMVEYLLKVYKPDVNAVANDGSTALSLAVVQNDYQLARDLMKYGVDINLPDKTGETPLINAVYSDSEDMVTFLVENGADTKARTGYGWTALMCAKSCGNRDIIEYLERLCK